MSTKLIKAIETSNVQALIKQATGFNYKKKSNSLEMSNNRLDLTNLRAYSYGWWCYVRNVEGLMVFNDHVYSATTRKHQKAMRSL